MANLLSKINIGGVLYDLKDAYAREELAKVIAELHPEEGKKAYMAYTDLFADDKAVKAYVDAQVGAIHQFNVKVADALPEAKEENMFVLYLIPDTNDGEEGSYIEYILVKNGEEYSWESIGTTKIDLSDYVTTGKLAEALAAYELKENLGALAYADEAKGTVTGHTISGLKANGKTAGSINVELEQSEHKMTSNGKFTPAGTVSGTAMTAGSVAVTAAYTGTEATISRGDYTPAGTVTADFSHAAADAELVKGTHTPEGDVAVALSGNTFNAITGVGTQAQFTEGDFTPADLQRTEVSGTYAEAGIVVKDYNAETETLTLESAVTSTINATKVTSFTGGSKAKDTFVANSLPTMAEQNVGVQSATFTGKAHDTITGVKYDKAALNGLTFAGTKAEGALVTGVTYDKAGIGSATFTGATVDINATFAGTEGDVAVDGACHDYAIKTAEFNGADVALVVEDIVCPDREVTVR